MDQMKPAGAIHSAKSEGAMLPDQQFFRRLWVVFFMIWAMLLNACTAPLVVDYQPFHNKFFLSRKNPAERHDGPLEELLLGGYLLIGYINVRQNIRNCWEIDRCDDILEGGPSDEQLAEAAAARGGDAITWLEGETNLERASYSYCTGYTYTPVTVNGKTSLIKVCSSMAQVKGFREYRVDRALIWRLEPELATTEANQKAIEKAMGRLTRDIGTTADHKTSDDKNQVDQPFAPHPAESETLVSNIAENDAFRQIALAIRDNDCPAVRRLAADPAINSWRDEKGRSLMILALVIGRKKAVNAMIEGGFKWQTVDHEGYTAIEYLAALGNTANLKTALKHGGSLKFKSKNGHNLLFSAVHNAESEVLAWLMDKGVDFRQCDTHGTSALMVAARYGRMEAARSLIAHKAAVYGADDLGRTPLMIAAGAGRIDMINLLLSRGARLKARDKKGNTALIYAAANGRNAVLDRLLGLGARLDEHNKAGVNPFTVAWVTKHWDTVVHLLDNQLIIKGIQKHGREYLRLAVDENSGSVVRALLRILKPPVARDDIDELLTRAVEAGKKDATVALIGFGADINRRKSDGRTLLMQAAAAGKAETASMLIELGADADATDGQKLTALMIATIKGHVEVVRRMRSLGVKN